MGRSILRFSAALTAVVLISFASALITVKKLVLLSSGSGVKSAGAILIGYLPFFFHTNITLFLIWRQPLKLMPWEAMGR